MNHLRYIAPPSTPLLCPRRTSTSCRSELNFPASFLSKRFLLKLASGALSVHLLFSSPSTPLLAAPSIDPLLQFPSSEHCQDSPQQSQDEPEFEDPEENMNSFPGNEGVVQEAWQIINDSYLDVGRRHWTAATWKQKREDLLATHTQNTSRAHDLIKKMLASLGDPYTRFLSKSEFSKMARYDMTGIGLNLREVPGNSGEVKLIVLGLLLDGPAHSAGVRQGDQILAVDGENVKGKSAFEVSSMLQGPNETFVNVVVKHGNCGPIKAFEIQRQVVARTPVFYRMEPMDNGGTAVGYIHLKEFNALARKDLLIAVKRLQDMGASYLILDLRDNLGGLVQAGIEIAKLFLSKGETVIYTVGRDAQYQATVVADATPLVSSPVIVLVNSRTASASEIVAAALHDNCRAVLVGDKTFGKGLIQSVFELHDGSGIVVTVGKYVTPKHQDINGNGLEPDFKEFPGWSKVEERLSVCQNQ